MTVADLGWAYFSVWCILTAEGSRFLACTEIDNQPFFASHLATAPVKLLFAWQEEAIFAEDIGNLIDVEADDRDGGPNYVPGPGSRRQRSSLPRVQAEASSPFLVPYNST